MGVVKTTTRALVFAPLFPSHTPCLSPLIHTHTRRNPSTDIPPTHPDRSTMRRIAMGAMALAGLSAFAQADHHHPVDECLSTITAAKDYFPPEAG